MPHKPRPFEMTAANFALQKRKKLEKFGNWWFAHSYLMWFFAAGVWALIAIFASFGASGKLAWVCGFVAFLHAQRGWELRKANLIITRVIEAEKERLQNEKAAAESRDVRQDHEG